jgi:GT2 family glycosyltransferase
MVENKIENGKNIVIAVINYNGSKSLGNLFKKSLESLIDSAIYCSDIPNRIILVFVDNASTDESISIASRKGFVVIHLNTNLGYAGASYVAYKYIITRIGLPRFLVLLNNDIVLDKEAFCKFLKALILIKNKYEGFIISPLLVNGHTGDLDYGGQFIDSTGATWSISLVMNRRMATMLKPIFVSYCDGAVLVADDVALERVGVFDPRFFMYYEDVELSLRAWSRGVPSILLPIIVGVHYRSATANVRPEMLYFNVRNRVYTMRKFFGCIGVLKVVLYYLFYVFRFLDLEYVTNPKFYLKNHSSINMCKTKKFVTRAIFDGIRMKQPEERISKRICPTIDLSLSDLFSMKKLYTKIVKSIVNIILSRSIIEG